MHDLDVELSVLRRQLSRVQELLAAVDRPAQAGQPVPGQAGDVEPLPLRVPWTDPVVRKPVSGQVLSPGLRFFAGKHHGWIQILQKRGVPGGEAFALAVDFTSFDGNWMSLVLDGRALTAGLPAGAARLLLSADIEAYPAQNVLFKCSWRHAGHEAQSRQGVPQPAGQLAAELDLGWLRPQDLDSLELHVIFPVNGRGSIIVQGVRMVLLLAPEGAGATGSAQDVFEAAP